MRQFLITIFVVLIGMTVSKYVYHRSAAAMPLESAPTLAPKPTLPAFADQILSRPIADLSLNDLEQSAALRAVADAAHANIAFISEQVFEEENRRVTLHLHDTTLRAALDAVLKLDPDGRTTYQMLDSVIFISFRGSPVFSDQSARIYDIRDIIGDYLRYEFDPPTPDFDWNKGPPGQHYVEAMTKLVAMLQRRISQFKYFGSMQEVAGRIIVVTDTEGHYKLERLLDAIRHVDHAHGRVEQLLLEPGQSEPRDDK